MPPDDRDLLRWEFRPILKRLGLYYPGFGWHAFRRQNVTWRQQVGGVTPLKAQRARGHGSLDMTYLYTLTDTEREARKYRHLRQADGAAGRSNTMPPNHFRCGSDLARGHAVESTAND